MLDDPGPILITLDGEWRRNVADRPRALLPGSFNPVHDGHWGLAQAAARRLGHPVAFELSVRNVDKPIPDMKAVQQRVAPFRGRAEVWLTHAPRFLDKAEMFPDATFVVGADTAFRLIDPRYYGGDREAMVAALARLASLGARFLVAARTLEGELLTLEHLDVPPEWRHCFEAIPVETFRLDLSSTELRAR